MRMNLLLEGKSFVLEYSQGKTRRRDERFKILAPAWSQKPQRVSDRNASVIAKSSFKSLAISTMSAE
jgi:hypothetical protein